MLFYDRFEKGFTMVEEEELGIAFCTRAKMRRQKARPSDGGCSSFEGVGTAKKNQSIAPLNLRSRNSSVTCLNFRFHYISMFKLKSTATKLIQSRFLGPPKKSICLFAVDFSLSTGPRVHGHPLVTMALREIIT